MLYILDKVIVQNSDGFPGLFLLSHEVALAGELNSNSTIDCIRRLKRNGGLLGISTQRMTDVRIDSIQDVAGAIARIEHLPNFKRP